MLKINPYTMVYVKFKSSLLYCFLYTFAVAGVTSWSTAPLSFLNQTADLVMMASVFFFSAEAVDAVAHS